MLLGCCCFPACLLSILPSGMWRTPSHSTCLTPTPAPGHAQLPPAFQPVCQPACLLPSLPSSTWQTSHPHPHPLQGGRNCHPDRHGGIVENPLATSEYHGTHGVEGIEDTEAFLARIGRWVEAAPEEEVRGRHVLQGARTLRCGSRLAEVKERSYLLCRGCRALARHAAAWWCRADGLHCPAALPVGKRCF